MFQPVFRITPAITSALIAIDTSRQVVAELSIDQDVLASLRATARLLSTHYSTQIEGNRLTEFQVKKALGGTRFPGREGEVSQVRNYFAALVFVEQLAGSNTTFSQFDIQLLHGLALSGRKRPAPYRDNQNVIREGDSNAIACLPAEASQVPQLMNDLLHWVNVQISDQQLPVPIIAAVAHFQLATIHPYSDGNGRAARLFSTLILQRHGYGLKGICSLDEYYARDPQAYYKALTIGPAYNNTIGHANADISSFLSYFLTGMADSFARVRKAASNSARRSRSDLPSAFVELAPRQRLVLDVFRRQGTATVADLATQLGLSRRTVRPLCAQWVKERFIVIRDPSRRNRRYRLSPPLETAIDSEKSSA